VLSSYLAKRKGTRLSSSALTALFLVVEKVFSTANGLSFSVTEAFNQYNATEVILNCKHVFRKGLWVIPQEKK